MTLVLLLLALATPHFAAAAIAEVAIEQWNDWKDTHGK
jgi:hypothetical protein